MNEVLKGLAKDILFRVPNHLKKNHVRFSPAQISELRSSIEANYLDRGGTKAKLSAGEYAESLEGQVSHRTHYNRTRIVPWLDRVRPLRGARVLEIGCGTGCSSLALAEQGAQVVGVDIDAGALRVARDRLHLAGFDAQFHELNGDQIVSLADNHFDYIIFYASLEHMTVPERLTSLKHAWDMLPDGGKLVILETPNRLWFHDSHTAGMPFFDWLPGDLAFFYSRFSSRKNFRDLYRSIDEERMVHFKRWGRGVSFHELDLAIAPVDSLNVVSYLNKFERTFVLKNGLLGLRYQHLLRRISGKHLAFLQPYLDLIIEKA